MRFLLILFIDMVKKKKKAANQKEKQVNFMPITKPGDRCCHMLRQDLLAMGHCFESN